MAKPQEAASRRLLHTRIAEGANNDYGTSVIGYFDPEAPIGHLTGNLPHWRQPGVTYFVTFRLADALPQERLDEWRKEMEQWLRDHPEPHDEATRQDFYTRFPARMQRWLDAGYGSCVLSMPAVRAIVENALRHFDGERYVLDEFVVASNHVHVLVTPKGDHFLSEILHSWKSFTAHEILKVEAASRRLANAPVNYRVAAASRRSSEKEKSRDGSSTGSSTVNVWQKESFDHIVRSPASLDKFREYIRAHDDPSSFTIPEDLRRDAAATLIEEACAPFDHPVFRDALAKAKQESEQTIDTVTVDTVIAQGFDAAAKERASKLVQSFREYLKAHQAEITALQILYSRPYRQRLSEPLLKELEKKLRSENAAWNEENLWNAFATTTPQKVKGRSVVDRFADLIPLVRFALEQQPVLEPFAESVRARFDRWLAGKQTTNSGSGVPPLIGKTDQSRDGSATIAFTPEQVAWLELIRDHIATSLSIEPEDFEYAPFSQQGGLGKAHQIFGSELPKLLEELNEVLAA